MISPRAWRRVAVVLAVLNLGGLIMALGAGEIPHAGGHFAAGVGLYVWIRRLSETVRDERPAVGQADRVEGLEDEVDQLRRELTEAQERLDFAERMIAQRPTQKS